MQPSWSTAPRHGRKLGGRDARALADAIGQESFIPATLQSFESIRTNKGERTVCLRQRLGRYMQLPQRTAAEQEMVAASLPDAVSRETAMPVSLRRIFVQLWPWQVAVAIRVRYASAPIPVVCGKV